MMRLVRSAFAFMALGLLLAGGASLVAANTTHRNKVCTPAPYMPAGQDNCTRGCAESPCVVTGNVCVCPQNLPSNGCHGQYHRDCQQFTVSNMKCYMASCVATDEDCPLGQVRCYWQQSTVECGTIPSVVTCTQL